MSECGYAFHTQDMAALGYCAACVQREMDKIKHLIGDGQIMEYLEPIKEKKCECGAQHTSEPNFHSPWCPRWRKV